MKIKLFVIVIMLGIVSCKDKKDDGTCTVCPCLFDDCFADFRLTDFEPAWSPDGKTIAYVHGDTIDGLTGIYLIDTNGTNKQQLYASISAYDPTWSPDSKWLAFSNAGQLYKIKITGDSLTQLTTEGSNFTPSWSPDGQWIAYHRSYAYPESISVQGIWILNSINETKIKVGSGIYPSWTSDSQHLVCVGFHGEVYRINKNDSNDVLKLTSLNSVNIYATDNRYPKYSNQAQITFTSKSEGVSPQIWVMNSDGSNLDQITTTQGYSCDWSPDGSLIVYTDSRSVNGRLWIIQRDGQASHQITF